MTVDANVLRSEPHATLGGIIQQDAPLIIERWRNKAAQEQPEAARVHEAALLDHLPVFLQELGDSLAAADADGAAQHKRPARRHGEQRWELGWSLEEVVRDYQILRLVLVDYLEQALDRPLRVREVMALGLALDEAIASSVQAFTIESEQEAERSRQALAEANQRKDDFLALLGHELRNPLSGIAGGLEILNLVGENSPEALEARALAGRQVKLMQRLVDDLLDVSRITQGKVHLKREPVDLALLAQQAVDDSRRHRDHQGLSINLELPELPAFCLGDPGRLTQVAVNLLNNACKFTDPGGCVTLRLTHDAASQCAVLAVQDNGIGISPEILQRIFQPFTQADGTADRSRGGLGLGLALVKGLVELHGGSVTAASGGLGHGSTFEVRLPLAAAPEVAGALALNAPLGALPLNALPLSALPLSPAPLIPVPDRGRRILVIDDNRDASYTVVKLLERDGHHVGVSVDGPRGLEAARKLRPDLIICDIGLPGMDGYEVARLLRADTLLRQTYLAAVTGYGRDEDRQRALEAGFDAHLIKPISLPDLRRVVQASVDRSHPAG